MLRCFNDCLSMLFLYASIWAILSNRWTIGSLLMSFALSIKMNILLFIPALAVLLSQRFTVRKALFNLFLMLLLQIILGLPFLLTFPQSYLSRAFDFNREFFYIWTVNLKVLPEHIFLSKDVSRGLLIGHVFFLVLFLNKMLV
jgi:alpha-1,3-mannosyltransferase